MSFEQKIEDYDEILKVRKNVRDFFQKLKSVTESKKTKEKLKYLRSQLNFKRVFSSDSVQGTAGLVTIKELDQNPIVFKVSNGVDYTIEHESMVLEDLKQIEEFCPHFMSKYDIIELPVSSIFFQEPHEEYGFMEDSSDYFMTQVMFTEYISRFTYYHYLRSGKIPIVNSLILQTLCGLHMSQEHVKLTHYDLHLDNILIRNCEENTIHLYTLDKDLSLMVPTYGSVPLVIDMGSSYSKSSDRLLTSIEHYQNGLQSCIYDEMNDLHHLLMSTLSCLAEDEIYKRHYDNVYYKLMCLFSPLPLWREKGWKILEHDLVEEIMYYFLENCTFVKNKDKRHMFKDYFEDIIETLNASIRLPLKELSKEEIDSKLPKLWDSLFEHIYTILDFESISNDTECVYVIKEIVNVCIEVNKGKDIGSAISVCKNRLNVLLDPADLKQINIKEIVAILTEMGDYMGSFYNIYIKDNMNIVNNAYAIMKQGLGAGGVKDILKVFLKNCPADVELDKNKKYVFYHFDSLHKKRNKKTLTFSEKECLELNRMSNNKKTKYILNKMLN